MDRFEPVVFIQFRPIITSLSIQAEEIPVRFLRGEPVMHLPDVRNIKVILKGINPIFRMSADRLPAIWNIVAKKCILTEMCGGGRFIPRRMGFFRIDVVQR